MDDNGFYDICAICGDKARGYNYMVASCDSCKQFFRRNTTKYKEYKCKSDGNCKIDCFTRKLCKFCRLHKCFAVGMQRPSYFSICARLNNQHDLVKFGTNSPSSAPELDDKRDMTDIISDILENNNISEEKINEEINEIESHVSNIEIQNILGELYSQFIKNEFSITRIERPLLAFNSNCLNECEENKLRELLSATTILNPNYSIKITAVTVDFIMACIKWVVKLDEIARNIITFTKHLSPFEEICKEDRIVLIKNHVYDIMYLHLLRNYNKSYRSMDISTFDELSSIIILFDDMKPLNEKLYEIQMWYLSSYLHELVSDPIILDLITVIVLLNPEIPKLIHRPTVKYQQYIYMYLLQRYLQIKYHSNSESHLKFSKLMRSIEHLKLLCNLGNHFLQEERNKIKKYMTPLVLEIYNMHE